MALKFKAKAKTKAAPKKPEKVSSVGGHIPGQTRISSYVRSDLYARLSHATSMLGEPFYVFLTKALEAAYMKRTTSEQRSAIEKLSNLTTKRASKK